MASLSDAEKRRRETVIERFLSEGHPPPDMWTRAHPKSPAIWLAAKELGLARQTIVEQCKTGILNPDWGKYNPPTEVEAALSPAQVSSLQLKNHRLESEKLALQAQVRDLRDQVIELGDARDWVHGLETTIRRPTIAPWKPKRPKGGHTAQVTISDVHCGETVFGEQINGLNSYDVKTCRARMHRLRDKVIYILKEHTSVAMDELIVLIMGDLISGGLFLHDELAQTDEETPVQSVSTIAEILTGVILSWRQELKLPIRVIAVPGNHGRTTPKNDSKNMVANSLDMLACYFVEREFSDDDGVTFYYPESGEAVYSIYNWKNLAIHGHNLGSGSGGGVYGPSYSMVRGAFKTKQSYAQRGVHLDFIFSGHLHTTLKVLPYHYSNGSVIGPNEYSMNRLKALPEPAQQNLHIFHETHGIVDWRELVLGVPSEGSIYER